MNGNRDTGQAIRAKGPAGPRVTPAALDATITGEMYHTFPGTTLTVCCLVLANGYAVAGTSAAVSAANFDAATGREVARADARDKIWALEGYLLRERLHRQAETNPGPAVPPQPPGGSR